MKKYIVIFILMISVTILRAQDIEADTLSFSLEESMQYAMENNLNAENARLDVDAADQRVWETAANGLPQVDASVNYNYNINLATTLIPDFGGNPDEKIEIQFGTKHYATAGLVANQLIFSGEYIIGLQAAKIFKEFTQRNKERTEQQVRQTVIENYYLVLLGENTLEALSGNRDAVRATYEETRKLYEAGFAEEIDADQLEVSLIDIDNEVLSLERQIMASRNLLKYQMGVDREKAIILTDSLEVLVRSIDIDASLGAAFTIEENIDYQILSEQERLAYMDVKLKRSEYLPSISAFYSLDYTAQRDEFSFFDANRDWYNASMVGLAFNVPIFSSGFRKAGVSQKKIAYLQAQNNKDFAAEGLRVEFMQSKYDFANALERFRSVRRNLEISQKVVRVTKVKYDEGMVSSLELTQVNNQYLQVLGNYTSSMVELLNAKIKIDLLMNNI
ncbi:MAG: TolC family protein [Bacteroides sp.]|nr:TolC family protein [Bacteroides sp.]